MFLDRNLVLSEQDRPNHDGTFCDERAGRAGAAGLSLAIQPLPVPGIVRIGLSRYTEAIEATAFQARKTDHRRPPQPRSTAAYLYLRLKNACAPLILAPQSIAAGVISLN